MEIKIGDFGISKQLNLNKPKNTKNKAGSIEYMAPEILKNGLYNTKSDMYSLGCIIYELLTLNNYFEDKQMNIIQKIDTEKYNYKWQKLISDLLQIDYNNRLNIDQVFNILENDNNKIIGEIYINENNINKDIQIINSFENCKRKYGWKDENDDYKYENEKEIKENIEIKINGK